MGVGLSRAVLQGESLLGAQGAASGHRVSALSPGFAQSSRSARGACVCVCVCVCVWSWGDPKGREGQRLCFNQASPVMSLLVWAWSLGTLPPL